MVALDDPGTSSACDPGCVEGNGVCVSIVQSREILNPPEVTLMLFLCFSPPVLL